MGDTEGCVIVSRGVQEVAVGSGNRVTETSAVPGKGDGKLVDRLFPGFGESMRGIWVSARGTIYCSLGTVAPPAGRQLAGQAIIKHGDHGPALKCACIRVMTHFVWPS